MSAPPDHHVHWHRGGAMLEIVNPGEVPQQQSQQPPLPRFTVLTMTQRARENASEILSRLPAGQVTCLNANKKSSFNRIKAAIKHDSNFSDLRCLIIIGSNSYGGGVFGPVHDILRLKPHLIEWVRDRGGMLAIVDCHVICDVAIDWMKLSGTWKVYSTSHQLKCNLSTHAKYAPIRAMGVSKFLQLGVYSSVLRDVGEHALYSTPDKQDVGMTLSMFGRGQLVCAADASAEPAAVIAELARRHGAPQVQHAQSSSSSSAPAASSSSSRIPQVISKAPTPPAPLIVLTLTSIYGFYLDALQKRLPRSTLYLNGEEKSSFDKLRAMLPNVKRMLVIGLGSGDAESDNDFIKLQQPIKNWIFIHGGLLMIHGERKAADIFQSWFNLSHWRMEVNFYRRTDHVFNANHNEVGALHSMSLPFERFSVKACMLHGVKQSEAVFWESEQLDEDEDEEEGADSPYYFPPSARRPAAPADSHHCCVALAPVRRGRVAFFGDVNAEESTLSIMCAMAQSAQLVVPIEVEDEPGSDSAPPPAPNPNVLLQCSQCKREKSLEAFSSEERRKLVFVRMCQQCIENMDIDDEGESIAACEDDEDEVMQRLFLMGQHYALFGGWPMD